ncbi:MAG: 2,3,4,5-tetrahydropyridine-2,6-dicarboxylate N-succinyltransferase [Pantoea sp. Brub]|nr:2,3,4,5-tetrahydropyridine-2,6-dicarboxylate N-succinyltransferase [Pantoea sp. Brub]
MEDLKSIINSAFNNRLNIKLIKTNKEICDAVNEVISLLNKGLLRVAQKTNNNWESYQWIKKAILLYFIVTENKIINGIETRFYDKIKLKFYDWHQEDFKESGLRIVPPATVRYGAYIAKNSVIMPSYINIGSFVDEGTMIDTWSTIGSCAQIGKNVHISGGVGIGGVLEPIQSNPTIIEDNCFIGARSEIVEGVIVEEGSIISMGVYIAQSTKIYDRNTGKIYYGRVPSGSVVVSGNIPSKDGKYSLYAAIIVKKVDAKTIKKVSINKLLHISDI